MAHQRTFTLPLALAALLVSAATAAAQSPKLGDFDLEHTNLNLQPRVDALDGQSTRAAACSTACHVRRMPPARAIAPEPPDLADELPAASLDAAEVENGASWSQVRLSDADLPGLAATGLSFREAVLARIDLAGGRLINLSLADVELDTCNLATIDARSGSMRA